MTVSSEGGPGSSGEFSRGPSPHPSFSTLVCGLSNPLGNQLSPGSKGRGPPSGKVGSRPPPSHGHHPRLPAAIRPGPRSPERSLSQALWTGPASQAIRPQAGFPKRGGWGLAHPRQGHRPSPPTAPFTGQPGCTAGAQRECVTGSRGDLSQEGRVGDPVGTRRTPGAAPGVTCRSLPPWARRGGRL